MSLTIHTLWTLDSRNGGGLPGKNPLFSIVSIGAPALRCTTKNLYIKNGTAIEKRGLTMPRTPSKSESSKRRESVTKTQAVLMRSAKRRLRYSVAMSLDGFIAGPNGEYDWIVPDPSVDFVENYKEFDVVLMGRKTFDLAISGPGATMPGMQTIVCSRSLRATDYPNVKITADAAQTVAQLKAQPGKDIWLFGGASLFRSLLEARLVDRIEVITMPILLSQGLRVLPVGERSPRLRLVNCKALPNGSVSLTYFVSAEGK